MSLSSYDFRIVWKREEERGGDRGVALAVDVSPTNCFHRSWFLTKSLGTFILDNAWKNSFEPVGLKFFLDLIASLTKSEMFEPGMVSPSIFTCPVLSQVITSGFAFKRDKSAVALGRMVLGMDSTTSSSDNCGSARCSSFLTGVGVSFCRLSSKKCSKYALNNFCFPSSGTSSRWRMSLCIIVPIKGDVSSLCLCSYRWIASSGTSTIFLLCFIFRTNFLARPERAVKEPLIYFRPFASNRSFYVFEKLSCSPMHGDVSCTVPNDASGALLME